MAEAGQEERQRLQVADHAPAQQVQTVNQQESKVRHGEGVRPVVVGRVPVAPAHHQHEPRQGLAGYPEPGVNSIDINFCPKIGPSQIYVN